MKTEYMDLGSVIGRRVRVYRNLDYKPDRVLLEDVAFIVGEDTRQRVVEKSRKLVHAFASGRVVPCMFADRSYRPEAASYDPYIYPTFYTLWNEQPIFKADYCRLSSLGMTIYR